MTRKFCTLSNPTHSHGFVSHALSRNAGGTSSTLCRFLRCRSTCTERAMRMYTEVEFHQKPEEVIPDRAPPRCYRKQSVHRREGEERMRWDGYAVAFILAASLL